jgi:hypothetical protein
MSNIPDIAIGAEVQIKVQGEIVNATYSGWSDKYQLAIVDYNGTRLYRKLQNGNGAPRSTTGNSRKNAAPLKQSRFGINTRFEFIEQVVDMVITGESKSVIITGDGGLGKTHTVMDRIKASGLVASELLEDAQDDDEEGERTSSTSVGDYAVVKGFITSRALYEFLYENRDRMIIFDDCDSVWEVPTSVSILKAALDSYDTRTISWMTAIADPDIPRQFEFRGRIIFVSNLHLGELDQAVLSRCLYVDVSMTSDEKIQRIRHIAPKIRRDMPTAHKDEVIALLDRCKDDIGDLNIRTFMKVCEIRHRGTENWQDLAEYVITAF